MTDRIGICVGCGTRFKVPRSFQGRSANCRKCGKTVRIESETPAKATAQPAIAPRKDAVSNAPAPRREDDAGWVSTLAFVLGCILVLGGGGYYAWSTLRNAGSFEDEESALPNARSANDPRPTETTRPATPTAPVAPAEKNDPAKPADPAVGAHEPAVVPPTPELPTLITFTHLARPTDCAEAIWAGFERTVHEAFRASKASDASRIAARGSWAEHRVAALCALLNGLYGLDLREKSDAAIARRLLDEIAATSFDLIRLPPPPTTDDPLADARYEVRLVSQLIRYWSERMSAPERLAGDLSAAEARSKQRDF